MLTETVTRQCDQVFDCLIESLRHCPAASFGLQDIGEHRSIGRIAMHIGSSIENAFMTSEFRQRWNSPVKSQTECLDYLRSCKVDLIQRFIDHNDLLASDAEPQYFLSRLDRVMKILRHIAHHTGEIASALNHMGLRAGRFV